MAPPLIITLAGIALRYSGDELLAAAGARLEDRLLRRRGDEIQAFRTPRDGLFYGWFGPIGLSAIYYASTAHRHLNDERIWTIASLCVFASIIVHGLTAAPFTRWYANAPARKSEPERKAAGARLE